MSERMTEEQWAMLRDYLADTGFASQEEEDLFAEAKHARASESALREERDDWRARHGHESEMRSYVIAERDELQAQVDALRDELERVKADLAFHADPECGWRARAESAERERDAVKEAVNDIARELSNVALGGDHRLDAETIETLRSMADDLAALSTPPKETP